MKKRTGGSVRAQARQTVVMWTRGGWRLIGLFLVVAGSVAVGLGPAWGQSLAEQYPPRMEELKPTSGWAPQFRRAVAVPERKRIPLRVDWADNTAAESPVTFGVPFARGALGDIDAVRVVDAEGTPVPAEFRVTATWDGPDGPVRWALGHALLRQGRDYYLEYGTEVTPYRGRGIQVAEADDRVTIDTGPMRVTLSRREATVVESVALDGNGDGRFAAEEELVRATGERADLPVVVDGAGVPHYAGGAARGLQLEVVEAGPRRATVRREGWYADAGGARFCKFITYTYFYAGHAGLRHDHTLVVAFDTNARRIGNIMLPVPLTLEGDAEAVFAGDGTPEGAGVRVPASPGAASLVQKQHDRWEVLRDGEVLRSGSRAGGWFGLSDGRRGAFAGVRDFWQQYPGELEADGHRLRVHLWPARGVDPLDLRPSSPWQLGDLYPGDHRFHNRWYVDGLDEMTQGYGVGKTHNLHLVFFAEGREAEARRGVRAQTVKPVLALPDPAYVCSTEAFFGRMHPRDPERFPELEALIDSVVATYYGQREKSEQYGWIHFGDVYNTANLWRRWASMFYGFPNVMPRLYLRSGLREAWDFHRVNTRHVTDIDICHLDNEELGVNVRNDFVNAGHRGKVKGMRYGGDGGIAHYAGDPYATGPDHHVEFMILDYYINGNLRTWEVANDYLKAHAAARDKHGSMLNYAHRGTGGALRLFCEAFQATWDPAYLSIMRQCADIFFEEYERSGVLRRDDVYMNPAKILYYQITGDERMREGFLNDMSAVARQRNVYASAKGGRGATLSGLAHAYWFTGDEKYLPFLVWQLDEVKEKGIEGIQGNYVARYATFGYQLPQAAALLDDVGAEQLPAAKGPALPEVAADPLAVKTHWAVYLLEEEDAAFRVTLDVDLDPGRYTFSNWREWFDRLEGAERIDLRVLDPNGKEIDRIELTPENTRKPLHLTVPADGKTGTYVLVPSSLVVPVSLHLTACTLEKRVVHAGENRTQLVQPRRTAGISATPPPSYFFRVPAGTETFRVGIKSAVQRQRIHYGIRNADGELLTEKHWRSGASPRDEWDVNEFDAGAPETDQVWTVTFKLPGNWRSTGDTYVRLEGVPGYVASSPRALFVPDPALRQELPLPSVPAGDAPIRYVEAALPWDGRAAYLGEHVVLTAPDGDGEMLNRRQGTLEFWVKTADNPSAMNNRTLLTCGSFRLMRRLRLGTYVYLGGNRFMRFFALPNHRWTHLAVTWHPSGERNADVNVRLFADGIEVKTEGIESNECPPDWPGESLTVGGGVFVSGLRVSDVVRYEENFHRPRVPFEHDEATRLLCPFDGDGQVWLFGKTRPLR